MVKNAIWNRRIDPTGGAVRLRRGDRRRRPARRRRAAAVPLRFDIQVLVPSTLRIENNLARLVASADLQLRGTYDRPLLFGRAEVDRGEVTFEGRRYLVTRGAIDFTNPARIEPFFDVEAETSVRVPGQTYRVIVQRRRHDAAPAAAAQLGSAAAGRADVLALLFSDVRRDAERATPSCARCRTPNERQTDILTTRATQLLASPVSSEVGRVVEQTFGVDTFQLTPSLIDPYSQSTRRRAQSVGAGHDRQAHLRPGLPDVLAQPQLVDQRPDPAARVRRKRSPLVDPVAERGRHLRASRSA